MKEIQRPSNILTTAVMTAPMSFLKIMIKKDTLNSREMTGSHI